MTKITSALAHFQFPVRPPPAATGPQSSHSAGPAGQAAPESTVDSAASKKAQERRSKLGRLRGMLHLQKREANDGIQHTARPLKGLNFALFKELMEEFVHSAASADSWKTRADSADRINQKLEGAEKHLGSLNDSEKRALADAFESLFRDIDKALTAGTPAHGEAGSERHHGQERQVRRTQDALHAASARLKTLTSTLRPPVPQAGSTEANSPKRKPGPTSRQDALLSACGLGSLAGLRRQRSSPVAPSELLGNTVQEKRQQLHSKLAEIQGHFSALEQHNTSPDHHDLHFDRAVLPILSAAENARTPGLNLKSFETFPSFLEAIQSGALTDGRALFPLPGHTLHIVAVDIKTINGQLSLLVIEPVTVTSKSNNRAVEPGPAANGTNNLLDLYRFPIAPLLNNELPGNAKAAVLSLDLQKSPGDCAIFGLSAASKMADEESLFKDLHAKNLAGTLASLAPPKPEASSETDEIVPADTAENDVVLFAHRRVSVLDARQLLPASFQKHIQSESSAKHWAAAPDNSLEQQVNKQGDTLSSRREKYLVQRHALIEDAHPLAKNKQKPITFNASIEQKRLVYLQRAIDHLESAPDSAVVAWTSHFDSVMKNKKMPAQVGLDLDHRKIGPKRKQEQQTTPTPDE